MVKTNEHDKPQYDYSERMEASVNNILVSGQDFPSQPSGRAVIIIHYVIILMNDTMP